LVRKPYFRERECTLLAGDAFTTVRAESMGATWTQQQEVHRPPAYFTTNWEAAHTSVERLARLEPEVAATGHGIAMIGDELRRQLQELAAHFQAQVPAQGRYTRHEVGCAWRI